MNKAHCPGCYRRRSVRNDGMISVHRAPGGSECGGSNQQPVDTTPLTWKNLVAHMRTAVGAARAGAGLNGDTQLAIALARILGPRIAVLEHEAEHWRTEAVSTLTTALFVTGADLPKQDCTEEHRRETARLRAENAMLTDMVVTAAALWFGEITSPSQRDAASEALHLTAEDLKAAHPRLRAA